MSLRLDDLQAPPAPPEFREELLRRIETGERLARGRRRAAALVAVAAGLVIASAASVSAFRDQTRPVDATYACSVPEIGGVYRVDILGRVRGRPVDYGGVMTPNRAEAEFNAGSPTSPDGTSLVGLDEYPNGYGASDQLCHRAGTAVPLSHAGLRPAGTVRGTQGATIRQECWLAPTVTIRAHVRFSRSGVPTAAQLVLRSGKKLRPAGYIDWTPTRVTVFASSACSAS
jgi:hypothetical protein